MNGYNPSMSGSIGALLKKARLVLGRRTTTPEDEDASATFRNKLARERDKLAHELGTPLSEILVNVAALRSQSVPPAPLLERIESAASRAVAILEASEFLFGRGSFLMAGHLDQAQEFGQLSQRRTCSLNSLIEIAENAIREARTEHVAFHHRYSVGCCLECIPSEIIQIFVNILRNAYDAFSGRGGGQISVRTSYNPGTELALATITAIVTDNGEGIPSDQLENVFRAGYSTRPGNGKGHGLSAAKTLVQKNNGSIEIHSPPQLDSTKARGTEVVVRFPRTPCVHR